jgi:DNA-directed RNA polymerase subunit L
MFRNYKSSGPALLTDSDDQLVGQFTLEGTSTTIANTLRRCILVDTRSVGFRADLTNAADPGVIIRKNTSVIFNEMLAHRLTLVPLAVRKLDGFDPSQYQCVLTVRNEKKGPINEAEVLHVTAADFRIHEKQADGTFVDVGLPAASAMFPSDPITGQTTLLVSLRPQWNPEQPPEEVDLTAFPVIGRGREHIGFSPVSQCSFGNNRDEDPVRQEQFFHEWLLSFKKLADPTAIPPEVLEGYRKEWSNMAIQRCFLIDEKGEPNSFGFTVESVGIRPVKDIVAEGIQAVIELVSPYADTEKSMADLDMKTQPPDSRMNGLDILFEGQEHTLGNLLQTLITELYIDDGAPDSPIEFVGYKIRHPLHRVMTLRLGFRPGFAGDMTATAKEIVTTAAEKARTIFEGLRANWAALVGGSPDQDAQAIEVLEG